MQRHVVQVYEVVAMRQVVVDAADDLPLVDVGRLALKTAALVPLLPANCTELVVVVSHPFCPALQFIGGMPERRRLPRPTVNSFGEPKPIPPENIEVRTGNRAPP